MFERYTERARRVIFLGRYEASQFGSTTIEPEHLLMGLIREDRSLGRFLAEPSSFEEIRGKIEERSIVRESVSTSIDLPLSVESKRILAYAAEEAENLQHRHIATEHILLGILREQNSFAAKILSEMGMKIETVRDHTSSIAAPLGQARSTRPSHLPALPAEGVVPNMETAKRIAEAVWFPSVPAAAGDRITASVAELVHGVWIVTGSHSGSIETALAAFIQKQDGKILRVHQEKSKE